jgi:hypothetical protein
MSAVPDPPVGAPEHHRQPDQRGDELPGIDRAERA